MSRLIDRINAAGKDLESVNLEEVQRQAYYATKKKVHTHLVERMDMASAVSLSRDDLSRSLHKALADITATFNIPLNKQERFELITDLIHEVMGYGPLENLINDESVQDILVNGFDQVYVEKAGTLLRTPVQFHDNAHLLKIIDKIVSATGRRVDESSPMVDARLPDGSRVNAVIPPLSLSGPVLSIRKFGKTSLSMDDLLAMGSLFSPMADFLRAAIVSRLNILISGGTGAGKTTFLNILSGFIPHSERLITIEDSAELKLHQPHVVRLESRPPNIEGRGEIRLTGLVKNSLRMRPDRIIIGEVRGEEVMDMIQAMNTGHPGSMSTIHANSPADALSRMEMMAAMGQGRVPDRVLQRLIGSAINLIVQLERQADGKRRVVEISEVTKTTDTAIVTRKVFYFDQEGFNENGGIMGRFRSTGSPSIYLDHFQRSGIPLSESLFNLEKEVT